jgi:NUMOD3 motif
MFKRNGPLRHTLATRKRISEILTGIPRPWLKNNKHRVGKSHTITGKMHISSGMKKYWKRRKAQ